MPPDPSGYMEGYTVLQRSKLAELVDVMDWYRRCLEDLQDGRAVRNLDEAKAGYDSAHAELLRYGGLR